MTIRVVPDTYNTIAVAYNAAIDGDTIYIKESGSPYNELMGCNKRLLFEGESTAVTWTYSYAFIFSAQANGIEIKNLHFTGAGSTGLVYSGGGTNDLYVHNCKFTGTANDAICLRHDLINSDNIRFNDNTFYGDFNIGIVSTLLNQTSEIKDNIFYAGGVHEAIRIGAVNSGITTVQNNAINQNKGDGIWVYDDINAGATLYIKDNNITGSDTAINGIKTSDTSGTKILTGNICKGAFSQYPIQAGVNTASLTAYFNDFYGGAQSKQGYDYDGVNTWDNGVDKGNYWGYGGAAYDSDKDAIGDNPYELSKNVGSPQDNYPLMCSINIWPNCPYMSKGSASALPIFAKILGV